MKKLTTGVALGRGIQEEVLKRGIRELNPDIHFDLGGKHDIFHPRKDELQGVFYKGKHVTTLSRGSVPEYDLWGTNSRGAKVMIMVVGWRTTFESLAGAKIPGVTRESLCAKFGVPVKYPVEVRAHNEGSDVNSRSSIIA